MVSAGRTMVGPPSRPRLPPPRLSRPTAHPPPSTLRRRFPTPPPTLTRNPRLSPLPIPNDGSSFQQSHTPAHPKSRASSSAPPSLAVPCAASAALRHRHARRRGGGRSEPGTPSRDPAGRRASVAGRRFACRRPAPRPALLPRPARSPPAGTSPRTGTPAPSSGASTAITAASQRPPPRRRRAPGSTKAASRFQVLWIPCLRRRNSLRPG